MTALSGFLKKVKIPPLNEVYREWFQSTDQSVEPWERQKAGFAAYAAAYNDARKRKQAKER